MQRVLLFMADRALSTLRVHQADGLPRDAANLSLDVVNSTLLQRLLEKSAEVRLTPDNHAQFSALLPPILRRLFTGEHLLLRSMQLQRPCGNADGRRPGRRTVFGNHRAGFRQNRPVHRESPAQLYQPQRLMLALQSPSFIANVLPRRPHMPDFSGLPLVIESSDLLGRLDAEHLILVDLDQCRPLRRRAYPRRAISFDPKRTQLGQPPAPGLLPNTSRPGKTLRRIGHTPDATYVVYDDEGGGWAGRFIWLLDVIGHQQIPLPRRRPAGLAGRDIPVSTEVPGPCRQPRQAHAA